jgi:hypothetical protein
MGWKYLTNGLLKNINDAITIVEKIITSNRSAFFNLKIRKRRVRIEIGMNLM